MQRDPNAGAPAARPTLFLLHALGMDRTEWNAVAADLGEGIAVEALDLPGFGANRSAGYTCRKMADGVARAVAARPRPAGADAAAPWMIAGHSMGGRVAMIVAAMAERGTPGLDGLTHVVLVASSTPEPEPIRDEARARMLGWVADGAPLSEDQAERFVKDNTAGPLDPARQSVAMAALGRTDPAAWGHWLDRGSREDWPGTVDLLRTPALLVAGADDGPLGEDAQKAINAPHFADATCETIGNAGHLIPLEQPEALATLIRRFVEVDRPLSAAPAGIGDLLAGPRVSARTRGAHLARLRIHAMPASVARHAAALAALVEAVVPGHGVTDLPERVGVALASGDGDGWRFADLAPDASAWGQGFDALDALARTRDGAFAELSPDARDALLRDMAAEAVEPAGMTAQAMARWFEDMRARIVRAWIAHPATMARIGYDGFANGGDGPRPQGYLETVADAVEDWQPVAVGVAR